MTSGANVPLGTRKLFRHARENGHPEPAPGMNKGATDSAALGQRFRGGAGEDTMRTNCWSVPLGRIAKDRVYDPVARGNPQARCGPAIQLDDGTNRRRGGNYVERLRHGPLVNIDDPALRIDEQHI